MDASEYLTPPIYPHNFKSVEGMNSKLCVSCRNLSENSFIWHFIGEESWCSDGNRILTDLFFKIWFFWLLIIIIIIKQWTGYISSKLHFQTEAWTPFRPSFLRSSGIRDWGVGDLRPSLSTSKDVKTMTMKLDQFIACLRIFPFTSNHWIMTSYNVEMTTLFPYSHRTLFI